MSSLPDRLPAWLQVLIPASALRGLIPAGARAVVGEASLQPRTHEFRPRPEPTAPAARPVAKPAPAPAPMTVRRLKDSGGGRRERRIGPFTQRILETVRAADVPLSAPEIALRLRVSTPRLIPPLLDLRRSGRLARTGARRHYRYAITPKGESALQAVL